MRENDYEADWAGGMGITTEGRSILSDIAKWTKFLSVLGFIFLGISVFIILAAGILISLTNSYMESASSYPYDPGVFRWFYAIIYLIILGIYFIPVYYLYKFSVNTKNALKMDDVDTLTDALSFLRKHYMFIGILTIIGVIFYMIAFLFMLFGVLANAF